MAVVTISRHFGAGGHTLGQMLCDRFDFRLADASVVDRSVRSAKLSPSFLNAMEKDDRQKYIAFLTQIFTAMANEGGGT